MKQTGRKDETIIIRCTKKEKEMIKKHAGKNGISRFLIDLGTKNIYPYSMQNLIEDNIRFLDHVNEFYELIETCGDPQIIKRADRIFKEIRKGKELEA